MSNPPADLVLLTEDELTAAMEAFIRDKPRTWRDIITKFSGQPYPVIYRSFGNLRHQLGRPDDAPLYPYVFSETPFAVGHPRTPPSNYDPRHG